MKTIIVKLKGATQKLGAYLGGVAQAVFRPKGSLGFAIGHRYDVECIAPDGTVKWRIFGHNLVVNTGLDEILDKFYKGSAYTAAHYVGLTDGTPTVAAGDTMASHVGWAEMAGYDEATRQTLTMGTVSGQSVNNSASKASFTMDGTDTTIGGFFITTNNTKDGTAGILIGVVAFTGGDKTVADNDTLNVTVTASASSS